jgi:hypothetical protein
MVYPILSGVMGAQSAIFAKSTAELVKYTISVKSLDAFTTQISPYIIIMCMVFTITMQVQWLNDGLARFDAMSIIPVFQTFWVFFTAFAGMVFYDEWRNFTAAQALLFPLGVAITLYGVLILSRRSTETESNRTASPLPSADDEEQVALTVNVKTVAVTSVFKKTPSPMKKGVVKNRSDSMSRLLDDDYEGGPDMTVL